MEQTVEKNMFSGLAGQLRAKSLLSRSLASGRIAHAYLFRGSDGIGKKLFAGAVARALNCRRLGPADSCGDCSSCRKFDSGNHPDYVVESPEKGVIKIDRVRRLCKSLSFPPYESARRVVVIEDIHTMRPEAANSLLKTLEEPPEDNVLILTVEASRAILPTISSRCQVIPFYPLSPAETAVILQTRHGFEEEKSMLLGRLAEGSPGRALLLEEHDIIATWKEIVAVLSDPEYRKNRHCQRILELAGKMAELKENLLPLLGLLRLWLRDTLVESTGYADGKNPGPGRDRGVFEKLQAINRAERELARNCNRSLVCEILLFRLQ